LAVLDVIREERLVERAQVLGQRLKDRLGELRKAVPQIADVRGPGSMVAVEFMKPGTREPDAEFAKQVQARALAGGLLLLSCGVYGNVIRFLFPLTISDELMHEGLAILEAALRGS
ncbi:MAG TPA: aminotransferase class III-fold pyridoxal phosphate-dependent enzyme, partial [Burkholderiaceae bacterium]|nr:aminotransferase class III-fold pyridoxal phosphate-dependent enzyme [Burkholderiaceae bacterium]